MDLGPGVLLCMTPALLNGIEFTVELREVDTNVTSAFDELLK